MSRIFLSNDELNANNKLSLLLWNIVFHFRSEDIVFLCIHVSIASYCNTMYCIIYSVLNCAALWAICRILGLFISNVSVNCFYIEIRYQ